MIDFIFAVTACLLITGLLLSPAFPELTVGFFIRDKSYHNRPFAVLLYLGLLFAYTIINVTFAYLFR
jgi:hypothetical protein